MPSQLGSSRSVAGSLVRAAVLTFEIVGLGAMGLWSFAVVQRQRRAWLARRRLAELLAMVVGQEARVIITGADSGVGLELARQLSRNGAVSLLLGCRGAPEPPLSKARLAPQPQVLPPLPQRVPYILPRTRCVHLELLDLDSVQRFAAESHSFFSGKGRPGLRLLINNAGVKLTERDLRGAAPPRTKNGFTATWQTNFLGPFLITEFLARRREKAGVDVLNFPVRVVQVSSGREDESYLDRELLDAVLRGETSRNEYADSKRALLLWTSVRAQSLAFKGSVFVHAANPGRVDTRLGLYWLPLWLFHLTKPVRMLLFDTVAEGALSVAAAGLHRQAAGKFGHYVTGEKMLEDLVIWRMPDKQLSVHLVRLATEATALEARAGGRPLSESGRPLSSTDLASTVPAEPDLWSTQERRMAAKREGEKVMRLAC